MSAARPGVFISFSRVSPSAHALAKKLREELGSVAEAYLDERDVRADEPWQDQLYDGLAGCTAAVLLLTRRIVGLDGNPPADWVLQEASILRFRKQQQDDFKLILALDTDLEPHELDGTHFGPLKLADTQLRRFGRGLEAQLLADLREAVTRWDARPPDEMREREIVAFLHKADLEMLLRVWDELHLEAPPPWHGEGSWARIFARAVARALLAVDDPIFVADVLVSHLRGHVADDNLARIVQLAAPSWVPSKAAAAFRAAVDPARRQSGPPPLDAVGVPVDEGVAVEHYAHRASGSLGRWKVVGTGVHAGENGYAALASEIQRGLKKKLYRPTTDWTRRPWVVSISARDVTDEILTKLRGDFPAVTFVVFDDDPDRIVQRLPNVTLLQPAPATAASEFRTDYEDAYRAAANEES